MNHRRHVAGDHHADDCIRISRENLGRAKKIILPDFRFSRLPSRMCFERFTRNDRRRTRPTFAGSIDFRSGRKKFLINVRFIFFFGLLPSQTQLTGLDSPPGTNSLLEKLIFCGFGLACCLFHDRPNTGRRKIEKRVNARVYFVSVSYTIFELHNSPYVFGSHRAFCFRVFFALVLSEKFFWDF